MRLSGVAPDIVQEMRYRGEHNFTGRPVTGYDAAQCWLTRQAAEALAEAQGAVSEFVRWAGDPQDNAMQAEFYPRVPKGQIIPPGAHRREERPQPRFHRRRAHRLTATSSRHRRPRRLRRRSPRRRRSRSRPRSSGW